MLFVGHMVTSSVHHTVLLTPQTASTSLEEEPGQCSRILFCVNCLTHNGNTFMQKNKTKQEQLCYKQETLEEKAANDSTMKENQNIYI